MSDFTHLHVHSHYSLLDGLGKVEPLLRRAKDMGMDALAITDHGAMYGAVEMMRSAAEVGIKPIIGLEAYLAPKGLKNKRGKEDANPRHLTLLAQNNEGYQNLIKLTTASHLEGFYYKPRIDYELLKEHSAGIIVLSGCLSSDISKAIVEKREDDVEQLLKWHLDVFGRDRFYLEVQQHATLHDQSVVNNALIKFAKQHNLGLVATADTHYIHPEDAEAHDVLICVQTGKVVQDKERMSMLGEDFSLKSPDEMKAMWSDHPAAIDNTQKISEMCEVSLEFGVNKLPHYPLPAKITPDEALRKMCEDNLTNLYKADRLDEASKRLDYELGVIEKTGYASYFLIVADFVNEAKRRGILVGPGRGSAAGSIVAFVTGITGLDPLHYELLFERFLNPERVSMPDIDLDFADDRRDEVIDYVREKYGSEHVAQIITFGTMAARAAIRDAGRALGLPYAFCDQVAKSVPQFMKFEEALAEKTDLKQMYESDPQAKRLIDTARKLEGVSRHASTHAAGVVITEQPLTEYLPLQLSGTGKGERDSVVTQYAMNEVEALGLLKMDFLGLKNLTIIQNALGRIKERHGQDIDIDNLPLDDDRTYQLLQQGKTTGVFQLESAGMKRYLKELKPTEFEDILSIVALYRPGPMDSIPDFIAAKHGRKKITYLHPLLRPILEKTYGVIVTQDQVLLIAREFAGFTYSEADILRKAVGKKIKKLLDEQREKFVYGAVTNKQIALPTAKKVWNFIEPFARYGFNRCLTGDTLICDPITGDRARISDLYSGRRKMQETFSVDSTYKILSNRIADVFYNGTKPVFMVATRTGRRVRATGNHPFLTADGWVLLEDMLVGDRIAVSRIVPEPQDAIILPSYKLATLGYLLAEGNLCHPNGIYFYSKSDEEISDYCEYLEQFDNTMAQLNRSKSAVSVYSKRRDRAKPCEIVSWLDSLDLRHKRAAEKHFPDFVWRLSNDGLALLLAKLWQGDGCISTKRSWPDIYYATSSQRLAEELRDLLLRFGIISTLHEKSFKYRGSYRTGYTVSINRHNNIAKFLDALARYFVGQKRDAANHIRSTHAVLSGRIQAGAARGSKDVIPVTLVQSEIRDFALELGITFSQMAKQYDIPDRFFYHDKSKVGFLRETASQLAVKLGRDSLRNLSESDVYWDEIVSIEPSGNARTYDLSMEGDHNFIANNIFVHNSHAACYAMIAYQTAYLKANYPADFMAALLTADEGNVDRQAVEVAEALSLDIEVLGPDINESEHDFTVVSGQRGNDAIRFGLAAIKHVGDGSVTAIVEERRARGKYEDIFDLFRRLGGGDINRKSVESLAKAGAFDCVAERNQVIQNADKLLEFNRNLHKKMDQGQRGLFGAAAELPAPRVTLDEVPKADQDESLAWEKELLGLYLSEHPLTSLAKELESVVTPLNDLQSLVGNGNKKEVRVAGVVTRLTKIVTKSGQPMVFAQLEDLAGKAEVLVFPKLLAGTGALWEDGAKLLVEGKLSDKDGEAKVLADKVWQLNKAVLQDMASNQTGFKSPQRKIRWETAKYLVISLPSSLDRTGLKMLRRQLAASSVEGGLKVELVVPNGSERTKVDTDFSLDRSAAAVAAISRIVGSSALHYRK